MNSLFKLLLVSGPVFKRWYMDKGYFLPFWVDRQTNRPTNGQNNRRTDWFIGKWHFQYEAMFVSERYCACTRILCFDCESPSSHSLTCNAGPSRLFCSMMLHLQTSRTCYKQTIETLLNTALNQLQNSFIWKKERLAKQHFSKVNKCSEEG